MAQRRRKRFSSDNSGALGEKESEIHRVGHVVWAKVHSKGTCWPGIIIDGKECGKEPTTQKVWVYWFGDHRITEVHRVFVYDFRSDFNRYFKKKVGKGYDAGVIEAIKECARRLGKTRPCLDRSIFINWAANGFSETSEIFVDPDKKRFPLPAHGVVPSHIRERIQSYRQPTGDDGNVPSDSETKSTSSEPDAKISDSPKSAVVAALQNKQVQLSELCLACFSVSEDLEEHPLFNAFLCSSCMTTFKEMYFSIGTDGSNFNCIVCLGTEPTLIYMCSQSHCFRSFCEDCLRDLFPVRVKNVEATETWECFMCTPYKQHSHGFIQPLYSNWKRNVWELFHKNPLETDILTNSSVQILVVGGTSQSVRETLERLSVVGIQASTLLLSGLSKKLLKELSLLFPAVPIKSLPSAWCLDELSLVAHGTINIVIGGSRELYSLDPSDKRSMNAVCIFDDFHRIVSDIKAESFLSPLFWLFEFEEPICPQLYGIISRFLAFEPGRWEQSTEKSGRTPSSTLVWTNVSLLWNYLVGEGLPK